MKKVLIVLLPLILACLCACVPKTPEPETTEALPADVELSTSEIQPGTNNPSSKPIDPLYNSFLSQSKYREAVNFYTGDLEDKYCATYDIDGNGTEELLMGLDTQRRDMGIVFVLVYSIRNGKVEEQDLMAYDSLLAPNEPLLYKNGTIRTGGYDQGLYLDGGDYYSYYRFEDGMLKKHTWLGHQVDDSYIMRRDFSNSNSQRATITKEEYDRVQKEMEGDGQVVKLDWKPVTDYTVTQPEE